MITIWMFHDKIAVIVTVIYPTYAHNNIYDGLSKTNGIAYMVYDNYYNIDYNDNYSGYCP